jgi:exopolysaccharide biosynthesis polyprenyl glycosylphosphotransferase
METSNRPVPQSDDTDQTWPSGVPDQPQDGGSVVPISQRPREPHERARTGANPPAFARASRGFVGPARAPVARRPLRGRRSASRFLFGRGWTSLRLLCDLLGALAAVAVAVAADADDGNPWPPHASLLVFPLLVAVMLHARGMYRRRVCIAALDDVGALVGAISVAAMTGLVWELAVHGDAAAGLYIGRTWVITIVLLGGLRGLLAIALRRARSTGVIGKPTLIVGAGVVGAAVASRLENRPEYGLQPVGFVDADPAIAEAVQARWPPVLGSLDELAEIAGMVHAEHVIFAFTATPDRDLIALARRCEELGLEVSLVPRLFEWINDHVMVERIGSLPMLCLRPIDPKGWQFNLKYALDRPIALLGLLMLGPLMLAVALAVRLTSPGPVFFRQRRMGRDGRVFDMLKFRSMHEPPADEPWRPAAGSAPGGVEGRDRRTRVGRLLRRTALDEIPQLINVLRGEMTMIGPRPERPEFASLFGRDVARYTDRHRVKSGITGWAQVCGLRGQTSVADRVAWDNYYIENWSPALDLKIAVMTLGAVARSGE